MIAVPRRVAVLRVLLLLLTALGVAGMHTMGHPSGNHGMSAATAVSHMDPGTPAHPVAVPVESMAVLHMALPQPGRGLDPSKVCLAVLTLVGLAVLIAAALFAARRLAGCGAPVQIVLPALGRGPPWRPSFGLVLADLSVLRR